jgi:hypothetical protein
MAIYKLERKDRAAEHDEVNVMIIRARNEPEARVEANKHCDTEGHIWTDPAKTSCKKVSSNGPVEVIAIDVLEG